MKTALLDLGTNTFHLLIVAHDLHGGFKEELRIREFVKLAADGIEEISESSRLRGLAAIADFKTAIDLHKVTDVKAVGTAALRTAKNGMQFLEEIYQKTGISVDIIDGKKEAELIYRGVRRIWHPGDLPALIMDIGGGSVEFIIADHSKILWSKSWPIGVAVLRKAFHHKDPMSSEERETLKAFLKETLGELRDELQRWRPNTLIGAAGTFDVLADYASMEENDAPYQALRPREVLSFIEEICQMTLAQRISDGRIPDSRVDMIVVAVCLVQTVVELHPFSVLKVSRYALKEGLLDDLS